MWWNMIVEFVIEVLVATSVVDVFVVIVDVVYYGSFGCSFLLRSMRMVWSFLWLLLL